MKNVLVIIIVAIIMAACKHKEIQNILPGNVNPPMCMVVDSSRYSGQTISFKNPFFYAGSGFGQAIICCARTQQWGLLLNMTSVISRRKFRDPAIVKMFKRLKINYTLKQVSSSKVADTFLVRYTCRALATNIYRDLKVDIENDSCRLIIDDLESFMK